MLRRLIRFVGDQPGLYPHFMRGTHGEGLRDKARKAMNLGAALFVTEWGTVNADGNGGSLKQKPTVGYSS